MQISPCFGWMNSDEYWRNATTQRAMELNDVYRAVRKDSAILFLNFLQILKNNSFNNFDLHYFDCPLGQVIDIWTKNGGQEYQLIEPVDGNEQSRFFPLNNFAGFHPNQISDALSTEVLWNLLEQAGLLPPINPHNADIEKQFGDQGGYIPAYP